MDKLSISGRQVAAARALLGLSQAAVAMRAHISVPTLKRMEASDGTMVGLTNNVLAVAAVLEAAGVQFVDAGDSVTGPGVVLK